MEQKILIVIVIILYIYIIFNKEEENLGNVSVIENNKDNIVIQDGDTKKKVSKVCTHMGCILNLNKDKLECLSFYMNNLNIFKDNVINKLNSIVYKFDFN